MERLVGHCLEGLPVGRVADEGVDPAETLADRHPDTQLDGELHTVPTHRIDLERPSHHDARPRADEPLEGLRVCLPVRLGDDRRGERLPHRLVARPAERLLRLAVPLDDRPLEVDTHERVARRLDQRPEPLLARPERLLDRPALGDVGEHAAPHECAILGCDDCSGIPKPAALAVARQEAVLGLVHPPGRVRADVLLLDEDALPVVRMELPRPEVCVGDPLLRGEPEDLLDLRAHIGPSALRA